MPTLLSLPAELRQRILILTLPPTLSHPKPWSHPLLNLLHISHRLRSDVAHLLSTWSPLHCISSPTTLRTLSSPSLPILLDDDAQIRFPRIENLCIDVFHGAEVDRMHWTCYCVGPENWSHPELVAAWAAGVRHLPTNGITAVHLDVTPAPASKRKGHPVVLNAFVSDRRCAKTFLGCHISDVSDLIRWVDEHYHGTVAIYLTGTLSHKSEFFIDAVQTVVGREVPFVGTWVQREQAKWANISHAVNHIAPEGRMRKAAKKGQVYPFKRLRQVAWSKETAWTWAVVAHEGEKDAAMRDLRMIAEFEVDGGRKVLEMRAVGTYRRALQHRISQDMGLRSGSEGEGERRYVVIRR